MDIAEEPIRSLSPDEREKLHNYLTDLRDHFEHYHERKENMSWAATTVYLGSIATLSATTEVLTGSRILAA